MDVPGEAAQACISHKSQLCDNICSTECDASEDSVSYDSVLICKYADAQCRLVVPTGDSSGEITPNGTAEVTPTGDTTMGGAPNGTTDGGAPGNTSDVVPPNEGTNAAPSPSPSPSPTPPASPSPNPEADRRKQECLRAAFQEYLAYWHNYSSLSGIKPPSRESLESKCG